MDILSYKITSFMKTRWKVSAPKEEQQRLPARRLPRTMSPSPNEAFSAGLQEIGCPPFVFNDQYLQTLGLPKRCASCSIFLMAKMLKVQPSPGICEGWSRPPSLGVEVKKGRL